MQDKDNLNNILNSDWKEGRMTQQGQLYFIATGNKNTDI
jgi:hypothetical protein